MPARTYLLGCALLAASLSGCGQNTKQSPPKDQVSAAVSAVLPPFLALSGIDLEPISTSPDTTKVNFKAAVAPKEDLFLVERRTNDLPALTLLKPVQAAGAKVAVYGFVQARRTMDSWSLDPARITSGLQQFGQPKGSFDAQSFVAGTAAADAALKQQAANAAEDERKQKALADAQEQARQAQQEQRQREEQATKQKLLQATAPGARYVGTLTFQDQRQRVRLVFTEQKGFLVRAEAENPDKPADRQTFSGELAFSPRPDQGLSNEKAYSILLSPNGKQEQVNGRWNFYQQQGSLSLNVTNDGLEGRALMFNNYTLRLQKEP